MEKIINKIFSSLFFKRNKQFKELLKDLECDLDVIYFEKFRSNLIHIIVQNNDLELLKYVINIFEDSINNDMEIRKNIWINSKNNLEFTPIFYAFYNGNIDIINYLLNKGADINILGKNGNTVIHTAIENDKVVCLELYKKNKLSKKKNNNGLSPFLYSIYMRSRNCINYFWANKTNLNDKDKNGNDAMLLAIIDGNTRLVFKLLVYGMKPSSKNRLKKTGFDIAKENNYFNIIEVININSSIKTCLNIKSNPNSFKSRKKHFLIFFILNLILMKLTLYNFNFLKNFYLFFGNLVYFLLYITFFLVFSFKKPTNVKKGKRKDYFNILKEKAIRSDVKIKVCHFCKIKITKSFKHCDKCEICVKNFYHHCQFLDVCISTKNLCEFMFFLIITFLNLIYILIFDILIFMDVIKLNENLDILRLNIYYKYFKYTNICIFIILILFLFMLLPLLYVQISNIMSGITTYERFQKKKKIKESSSDLEESLTEFSLSLKYKKKKKCGILSNMSTMLFKNR